MPWAASLPPQTAVGALWQRIKAHPLRQFFILSGLCLGITLLLTAFRGRGFVNHAIYSFSIGFACTLFTHGCRLMLALLSDVTRRWRGQAPSTGGFESGWRGVLPASVLAAVLGMPLGLAVADGITGFDSGNVFSWRNPDARVTIAMTVLGTVISVVVLSALERLARERAQAEAARRQAAEHQLRLLQSQLEPHMLFNTLANLRVLIGVDAARAQEMLDRLIGYLRSTLAASRSETHSLAAEFERLQDYLSLMGVRMGSRLQVQLDLPEALRALPVPPLVLQPLVENAIQHGLEPHVAGGRVEVQARTEGGELVLTVRNTGASLGGALSSGGSTRGTGFGLTQVRERLATLHGHRASLVLTPVSDAEGGTLALIRLPLPTST